MVKTYTDGIGILRCAACHATIRAGDGQLLAPMRVDELEAIAIHLSEVTAILERACGRNLEQLKAAAAEAIPPEVKTDRAGLLDEEADH